MVLCIIQRVNAEDDLMHSRTDNIFHDNRYQTISFMPTEETKPPLRDDTQHLVCIHGVVMTLLFLMNDYFFFLNNKIMPNVLRTPH